MLPMTVIYETDRVSRLVRRGPVTIDPAATLREVSETLVREEVGVALAVRDGVTIGLVSERDIVAALADGADPDDGRVEDVMAFEVVCIDPKADVATAGRQMLDGEIRHLLVGDGERAVGVISIRDVLAACLNHRSLV